MSAMPVAAAGRTPTLTTAACPTIAPTVAPTASTTEPTPNLDGRITEHLLGIEREDERHGDRERAEEEHHRVRADERARAEEAERHERRAVA
jgi:hypothetical protein